MSDKSVFNRYKAPEGTYGHIQWKGTDLCMDFTCECGNSVAYAVKCEACGAVWGMNPYIRLERLTPEEAKEVEPSTVIASAEDEEEEELTTVGGMQVIESEACSPGDAVLLNRIERPNGTVGLEIVRIANLKL